MQELKFSKPDVKVETDPQNPNKASFTISPLERGYGTTIGNTLRRILLSSLPGTAIVNVRIDGVEHEFQTIEGVHEDVMSIVLNLKRVIFHTDSIDSNFEKHIELHASGEGVVTAGDFSVDTELKVINPDRDCDISEGGSLSMFLTVRRGIGYVEVKTTKFISNCWNNFIDSLFTPVLRFLTKLIKQELIETLTMTN